MGYSDEHAQYLAQMYNTAKSISCQINGPTIMKYTAYQEPLKDFSSRYCATLSQLQALDSQITMPPVKVEIRYKSNANK